MIFLFNYDICQIPKIIEGQKSLNDLIINKLASSFHGMISSFHAVFGLRHRGKSAKVIDYNDQVIWVREYLLLLGIPHVFY